MKRSAALVPLSREHHTALLLCLRIEREAPDADPPGIAAIYSDLIGFWARGLLPHFRAENECLLARLVRHVSPEDELVRRTQRDHLGIEALVASMRDTADAGVRRALLADFAAALRVHVRWEEDELFKATERSLTPAELSALGEDITERVGDGESNARDVWPALLDREGS